MAFFATGIFFDIEKVVLIEHRSYVYLNPMAGLLKNYRQVLLYGQWPSWNYLFLVLLFGIILVIASIAIIKRADHIYPRITL
jgi:lipopolysaccharide transport system permease protein